MLKLDSLFSGSLKYEENASNSWICGSGMYAMEEVYEVFEEGVHHFELKKLH